MSNLFMMVPPNAPQATVNGTLYSGAPNAVVSVAPGDVAGLQAIGWIALTVRMMAPSGVSSVSVGSVAYNVFPDGTIWAAPGDVANLEVGGFTVISPSYTAPAAPKPVTVTMRMPLQNQSFQPPGSPYTYKTGEKLLLNDVAPQDVPYLIAQGGYVVSISGPEGISYPSQDTGL